MHRISLRGPWQITHSAYASDRPIPQRLPATWEELFGQHPGTAVFLRTFHTPTNLEPTEVVRLVLTGCRGVGTVVLNGDSLGSIAATDSSWQADITSKLKQTNKLRVEITFDPAADPSPGGLYDVVELQIEDRPVDSPERIQATARDAVATAE